MNNIQKVDLNGMNGLFSDEHEMIDLPDGNPNVLHALNSQYSGAIISVVGLKEDTARIRHEIWILNRDGDVSRFTMFESDGIYYSMVVVELD
jgi:hypothetical protein